MKRHSKKNAGPVGGHGGQVTVELALMMIVVVGAALAVSQAFRSGDFLADLVSGPWKNLSGMIEAGVWAPPEKALANHPNTTARISTVKGVPLQ